MIMAENKGVVFHRVMLRIEENLDIGKHRKIVFGRIYHNRIEVRGSKQRLAMSQIGKNP